MKKNLVLLFSVFVLAACAKENEFSYLIQHPDELRQAVAQCQNKIESDARCNRIMSIAERFDATVNKELQNREALGEYVMETQSACLAARLEWQKAQERLAALKTQSASSSEMGMAQKDVVTKKQIYDDKHEEILIVYAVIGSNSPE